MLLFLYRGCRVPGLPVAGKHFFEPISRLPHGDAAGKIVVAATPRFTCDYPVRRFSLCLFYSCHGYAYVNINWKLVDSKLYSKVVHLCFIFGMAAMPFPCNGILLIQGILPRIFPMYTLRQASFPIPFFKLFNYKLSRLTPFARGPWD